MTLEFIDGPQGRLAVSYDQGTGTPILFVHSDCGVLQHWDQIRKGLAGRPTAAFDRRGHGRSDFPANGAFGQEEAAQDIAAVAVALWRDEPFVLVGHSGGAANAFTFAAAHPDKVTALVLVDPPPDPSALPPGMMEQVLQALRSDAYEKTITGHYRSVAGDDPAVLERVLADVKATRPETVIGVFEALTTFRPRELAGRFTGPRLAIFQSQFDVDGAVHSLDPGFGRAAIDGVGHWIHLGAPDRFEAVLEDFFERVEGRQGTDASRGFDAGSPPV